MNSLKRGDRIAERYVIVERVGEGGMGVVYSARDENLRRTVAIKLLSAERVGNKNARARLKREARAAAAFANPGIAQVFEFGETPDGGAFLVMELVRGKSVRPLWGSSPDRVEALRIVREVARTLGAAHREHLIHRDVKPDNIMIREDGRVMLLDFGIAKDVGQPEARSSDEAPDSVVTAQGAIMGTPPYIAPEQIQGKGVGPASDQFALAVVAFGFLTGKRPWESMTDLGILGQILMDPPFAATSLAPTLPKAVDAVFDRALSKVAAQRYPNVEAFADALETAVTGTEVVTDVPAAKPPVAQADATGPYAAIEKTPPPEKTPPAPEKTPPPEKTPGETAPSAPPAPILVDSPTGPGAPSTAPPAPQRVVWKIRVDDEPPPSSTGRLVIAALIIAILAAAGGVWYGRHAAPPPPTETAPSR